MKDEEKMKTDSQLNLLKYLPPASDSKADILAEASESFMPNKDNEGITLQLLGSYVNKQYNM